MTEWSERFPFFFKTEKKKKNKWEKRSLVGSVIDLPTETLLKLNWNFIFQN